MVALSGFSVKLYLFYVLFIPNDEGQHHEQFSFEYVSFYVCAQILAFTKETTLHFYPVWVNRITRTHKWMHIYKRSIESLSLFNYGSSIMIPWTVQFSMVYRILEQINHTNQGVAVLNLSLFKLALVSGSSSLLSFMISAELPLSLLAAADAATILDTVLFKKQCLFITVGLLCSSYHEISLSFVRMNCNYYIVVVSGPFILCL